MSLNQMLRCHADSRGYHIPWNISPEVARGQARTFMPYNGFKPEPPECCQFKRNALRYRPAFIFPTADHMVQFPRVVFIVESIHNYLQKTVSHALSLVTVKECDRSEGVEEAVTRYPVARFHETSLLRQKLKRQKIQRSEATA